MSGVAIQENVEAAVVQLKKVSTEHTIKDCVREAITNFLKDMDGHAGCDLYNLLLDEVEQPLLETVLQFTKGNQTHASEILGINRGTLRKKLRHHGLA
jgi:Fis family transcriptional regulator